MKVVILAGGYGTRLEEETTRIPKPMIQIGRKPILWHIMKIYSYYGYNDFIICLGYKGYIIKEYFINYHKHMSDMTIDLSSGNIEIHNSYTENWKVTLVDTGLNTMTGGRIKKVKKYIGNETFMLTYGDGVGDVNIKKLVEFHRSHGRLATITVTQPIGRFGVLDIDNNNVVNSFIEKPKSDKSKINAGFFVLEPEVIDYIDDKHTAWENGPLEKLAREKNLKAYQHNGFWKPMDTLRDKHELENLWNLKKAPWKIW
ncbi:glucose-1-phosphate cytidylyltransferase [Tepiditoga spiralis]|uniref:Glucose-1-phosphate cytidylyltransferase n=1 Tax=Tepiditoga spiralis TaxID=2108365 RepID=A0A7G1G680_9BACT|nr:glucose-1-phosphate cytidylyltransferase [Tepiditoga spiralis]BBE30614.1 glucose-1-phosphate cytidylyltransferase [Tepiditoga spiralis]